MDRGTLEKTEKFAASGALRKTFDALVIAATIRRGAGEVDGSHGRVWDERGGDLQLSVDLFRGIEVIDIAAVFITEPTRASLASTRVQRETFRIDRQAIRHGAITLGGVSCHGGDAGAEDNCVAIG